MTDNDSATPKAKAVRSRLSATAVLSLLFAIPAAPIGIVFGTIAWKRLKEDPLLVGRLLTLYALTIGYMAITATVLWLLKFMWVAVKYQDAMQPLAVPTLNVELSLEYGLSVLEFVALVIFAS